jgi:hypothetical protein
MSVTKEDVKVERMKPLESLEGIGGVVEDEGGEEDEGGVVVTVAVGEVEVISEVVGAEVKGVVVVTGRTVVEGVWLVEGSLCEEVILNKGSILKTCEKKKRQSTHPESEEKLEEDSVVEKESGEVVGSAKDAVEEGVMREDCLGRRG